MPPTSDNAGQQDRISNSAALVAENERLRHALQVILDCPNPDSVEQCHDAMWQIASEALDPPNEDTQQGCS